MKTTINFSILAASLLAFGCAHDPSRELVEARTTYEKAATGPSGTTAKAQVYDAKKALDRAEQAHDRKSGSPEEIDFAYVALRRASNAIAQGTYLQYQQDTKDAKASYVAMLEAQKDSAETRLDSSQTELAAKSKDLAAMKIARAALEKQLMAAMASLSDMAKIKQEDQRTVITLNGAVLFRSDDTQLLPIAQDKLAQVAAVLQQYGDEYTISVNGHTDSRGSDAHNQQLSQARAESVRGYLVSKGVSGSMVTAFGRGESQPVAGNTSAEGRADNRRVEIIVDRAAVASASTPKPGT
ncbi:MAG: OmpA family protein [Deltaproteobacteria bacterium]|nr:OmpA family protein [Nannocystaceae bacterium]